MTDPRRSEPPMSPRRRVLAVDDEPLCGAMIQRALRRDCDVTVVGGGGEALALIRAGHDYDLILCDLSMPQVSGEDVFRVLTQERPELATRMVIITGGPTTDAAARFLATMVGRVLFKPFDRHALLALIDQIAGGAAPSLPVASSG